MAQLSQTKKELTKTETKIGRGTKKKKKKRETRMRNVVAAILFLWRARRHFAKRDAEVDAKPVLTA